MNVTIKREWLKACGRDPSHNTFEVKNVWNTNAPHGTGFETMFEVIAGDGTWVVAIGRTEAAASPVQLTLRSINDLSALDDAFEGALEALADDNESTSDKANDYNAILNAIRTVALRRYPVAFPLVATLKLSPDQSILLTETVQDQIDMDSEFTGNVLIEIDLLDIEEGGDGKVY